MYLDWGAPQVRLETSGITRTVLIARAALLVAAIDSIFSKTTPLRIYNDQSPQGPVPLYMVDRVSILVQGSAQLFGLEGGNRVEEALLPTPWLLLQGCYYYLYLAHVVATKEGSLVPTTGLLLRPLQT